VSYGDYYMWVYQHYYHFKDHKHTNNIYSYIISVPNSNSIVLLIVVYQLLLLFDSIQPMWIYWSDFVLGWMFGSLFSLNDVPSNNFIFFLVLSFRIDHL
jgi:hypothetical protein